MISGKGAVWLFHSVVSLAQIALGEGARIVMLRSDPWPQPLYLELMLSNKRELFRLKHRLI